MIKATIDQKFNAQIYQGEDRTYSFYLYDAEVLEPIDLTDLTIVCKLLNDDDTVASFTGVITSATLGKFDLTITNVESALLKASDQKIQLELTNLASEIDIQVLANSFLVESKLL